MRSISLKSRQLAAAFIARFPVMPGHPGQQHIQLNSDDLDSFAIDQGAYAVGSSADLNAGRAAMVARLNNAGSAQGWVGSDQGFQIVVFQRISGIPTIWEVKPVEVAMSHASLEMPSRNKKTIVNRALKIDRMFNAVDLKSLPKEEQKALKEQQDVMVNMAQLQATIAGNQNAMLEKTRKRLAKVDPQHRLLPR